VHDWTISPRIANQIFSGKQTGFHIDAPDFMLKRFVQTDLLRRRPGPTLLSPQSGTAASV
jgi:hypothetical protein